MNLPEDPPCAIATQSFHDETQNQNRTQQRLNKTATPTRTPHLSKSSPIPPRQKNKMPNFIFDLVMLTKEKNESINNNKKHKGQDGNGKNTICNSRIEHATTATIDNNRFTTKCTLDSCPEKQNLAVNQSTVHQRIFEAI